MPRYEDYGSAFAVVNPDGTTTMGEIQYDWDGSSFVRILHITIAPVGTTTFRAEVMAQSANEGDISLFSPLPNGKRPLMPMYIAWLRVAIERGYTTLERAELVFKDFVALGAAPWGLDPDLPDRVPAEQELKFFGEDLFTLMSIPALDVLTRPNPYVDSTAIDTFGRPWTVPAGIALNQAVAEAWAGHKMPEVDRVARALLEEAAGVEHTPATTPYLLQHSAHQESIQKLYLAFFLRPADPGGFNYYANQLQEATLDVRQIAVGFGASPEYVQTYAGLNTSQRIDTIYRNLFGRPAEDDGLRYWGERLDAGTFNISNIAFSILLGAQNDDLTTITHRIEVAQFFTASVKSIVQVQAYAGLKAAAIAREFLSAVTNDPISTTSAARGIEATVKLLGASGVLTSGPQGDFIALEVDPRKDILIYGPMQAGRTDTITGFQVGDTIDLSNLKLGSAIQWRTVEGPKPSMPGLFGAAHIVIDRRDGASHIYLDVNLSGGFEQESDGIIQVIGAPLTAVALAM